jgi:hypothetical protein
MLATAAQTGFALGTAIREASEQQEAEAAAQRRTRAQQAAAYQQREKQRRTEALQRILPQLKGLEGSESVRTAAARPASARDERPEIDAYVRGEKDAADCKPQHVAYCNGTTPKNLDLCRKNYRDGYKIGESKAENTLREAHRLGRQARAENGEKLNRAPRGIQGTCGAKWIAAYNSGYSDKPFTMVGR